MQTLYEKIWNGDIPEQPLYKDEEHGIMVLLDAFPATYGHSLVIPREPIDQWDHLTTVRKHQVSHVAYAMTTLMETLLPQKPERIMHAVIGYGVPHAHYQVVPLYERSDSGALHNKGRTDPENKISPDVRAELTSLLSISPELSEELAYDLRQIGRISLSQA